MTYSTKEIEKYFYSIDNLPTLPVIAMQLFSLIEEEASMRKIAKVIGSDPSLTTKVLKISNSAFYGVRKKIDTLDRALVILGINEINNIVHGISFFNLFPQENVMKKFDMVKFWEHSLMVAQTAKILANKLNVKTHGEEYTSGLIHDIGKLIISQYFQKEFKQIINSSYGKPIPMYLAEKMILGTDHQFMGHLLMKKWGLPNNLIQAVSYHHNPEIAESSKDLVSLVFLANYYANRLNIVPMYKEVSDKESNMVMKFCNKFYPEFDMIDFEAELSEETPKIRLYINELIS